MYAQWFAREVKASKASRGLRIFLDGAGELSKTNTSISEVFVLESIQTLGFLEVFVFVVYLWAHEETSC